MVDTRRSMADAMLSPEKVAFIRGDGQKTRPSAEPRTEEVKAGPLAALSKPHEIETRAEVGVTPPVLVPLTTRLHPEVADALRRANLEQRLKRRNPQTVQEIVEEALRAWLVDAGYLPSNP